MAFTPTEKALINKLLNFSGSKATTDTLTADDLLKLCKPLIQAYNEDDENKDKKLPIPTEYNAQTGANTKIAVQFLSEELSNGIDYYDALGDFLGARKAVDKVIKGFEKEGARFPEGLDSKEDEYKKRATYLRDRLQQDVPAVIKALNSNQDVWKTPNPPPVANPANTPTNQTPANSTQGTNTNDVLKYFQLLGLDQDSNGKFIIPEGATLQQIHAEALEWLVDSKYDSNNDHSMNGLKELVSALPNHKNVISQLPTLVDAPTDPDQMAQWMLDAKAYVTAVKKNKNSLQANWKDPFASLADRKHKRDEEEPDPQIVALFNERVGQLDLWLAANQDFATLLTHTVAGNAPPAGGLNAPDTETDTDIVAGNAAGQAPPPVLTEEQQAAKDVEEALKEFLPFLQSKGLKIPTPSAGPDGEFDVEYERILQVFMMSAGSQMEGLGTDKTWLYTQKRGEKIQEALKSNKKLAAELIAQTLNKGGVERVKVNENGELVIAPGNESAGDKVDSVTLAKLEKGLAEKTTKLFRDLEILREKKKLSDKAIDDRAQLFDYAMDPGITSFLKFLLPFVADYFPQAIPFIAEVASWVTGQDIDTRQLAQFVSADSDFAGAMNTYGSNAATPRGRLKETFLNAIKPDPETGERITREEITGKVMEILQSENLMGSKADRAAYINIINTAVDKYYDDLGDDSEAPDYSGASRNFSNEVARGTLGLSDLYTRGDAQTLRNQFKENRDSLTLADDNKVLKSEVDKIVDNYEAALSHATRYMGQPDLKKSGGSTYATIYNGGLVAKAGALKVENDEYYAEHVKPLEEVVRAIKSRGGLIDKAQDNIDRLKRQIQQNEDPEGDLAAEIKIEEEYINDYLIDLGLYEQKLYTVSKPFYDQQAQYYALLKEGPITSFDISTVDGRQACEEALRETVWNEGTYEHIMPGSRAIRNWLDNAAGIDGNTREYFAQNMDDITQDDIKHLIVPTSGNTHTVNV